MPGAHMSREIFRCAIVATAIASAMTVASRNVSAQYGGGGNATQRFDAKGNYHNLRNDRKGSPVNQERDSGLAQRFIDNLPQYKPEYWDKVDYLDVNGNVEDTNFHCFPAGVPRMGPPTKIMATPTEVVFLYNQKNTWRLVPMNRPHDPINSKDQTYLG